MDACETGVHPMNFLPGENPDSPADWKPRLARAIVLLFVGVLFLAVRLPGIALRPVHTDEAINGYTVGKILEGEPFRYDPKDYHGPSFIALATLVARVGGAHSLAEMDVRVLRWSAVVSGLMALAFVPLWARSLGTPASLIFVVLLGLDPLSVYYGRYAIHETLFVSATAGFLACLPGMIRRKTTAWALGAGLCAGLMLATKETAVIPFVAAGVAAWTCLREKEGGRWKAAGVFLGAAVLVIVLAFTWGLQAPRGLVDLVLAYPGYFVRAGGAGHEKPFFYYSTVLLAGKSGWLLVGLAVVGGLHAWRSAPAGAARFLSVYALIVWLAYSAIPYKTPWLALGIWLPLALLAATALGARWNTHRAGTIVCIFVLLGFMGWDTRDLVFRNPVGERNPFAYSHTQGDIERLPKDLEKLSAPLGHTPRIAVVADDPWPLPWYLRKVPQVGYWRPGDPMPRADFLILDVGEANRLESQMGGWRPHIYGQRPGVLLLLYSPPTNEAVP